MDFDDPFSEPVAPKAPTTSRFQPKAKPRPKKGPLAVAKATKKPSVTSVPQGPVLDQSVQLQPNDNLEKKSDDPVSSSVTVTESLVHALEDGNISFEAREATGAADIEHMEVASSSTITKDLDVDTSLESQLPTDIICRSTTTADCPAETSMLDASSMQNEEDQPDFFNVSFDSASTLKSCNSQNAPGESRDKTCQDSECFTQSIVCGDGDFQIHLEQLRAEDFSCLDTIDITTEAAAAPEKRAVKYQSKPKALSDRQKDSADILHTRLDGNLSLDSSLCQPDSVVSEDRETLHLENQQQINAENLEERESYDAFDSSAKSIAEGIVPECEGNENRSEQLDGMNGGFHDNSNLHDRVCDESALNRDENNDGNHLVDESSQKKRSRKSKKVSSENSKPSRKRKQATQEPDEAIVKPPKKFPRRTRQKRCVDKSLLEAPEDELDLQRVPIRDLIILAEYKERQAKKQAAAADALPPPTSERLTEDLLYDDNGSFGFDQDGDAFDNPSTSEVVTKDTGYFNYHTYMTKEPRARWMKHDTELFYKGISQFGSDLSMIQQLFPGRTRHQIKLKYKKEERQNPMRLNDALTNRAQDLSHFELVITRLQEQAAQEAKSDGEDSVCPVDKDEEQEILNPHNEDVANSEQNKQGKVAEQEPDKRQVESPSKSYNSEDEDFDWSAYKSEL